MWGQYTTASTSIVDAVDALRRKWALVAAYQQAGCVIPPDLQRIDPSHLGFHRPESNHGTNFAKTYTTCDSVFVC